MNAILVIFSQKLQIVTPDFSLVRNQIVVIQDIGTALKERGVS